MTKCLQLREVTTRWQVQLVWNKILAIFCPLNGSVQREHREGIMLGEIRETERERERARERARQRERHTNTA